MKKEELEKLKTDYAKIYDMPEMYFQDEHFFILAKMLHLNLHRLKIVQQEYLKQLDTRMIKIERLHQEENIRQQEIFKNLANVNKASNNKLEGLIQLFDNLLKERITLKTYSFNDADTAKAFVKEQSAQRILNVLFFTILGGLFYIILRNITK